MVEKTSASSKVNDGFTPDFFTFNQRLRGFHLHNPHEMTSILQNLPNYDEDVDFQALALKDVEFAKFYHESNGRIDFQDPKALQSVLTRTIFRMAPRFDYIQTTHKEPPQVRLRSRY